VQTLGWQTLGPPQPPQPQPSSRRRRRTPRCSPHASSTPSPRSQPAALQQWDLTQNQRQAKAAGRRFSLHQRWLQPSAKPCEGNVLLVEVTTALFDAHSNAVFVLRGSGKVVRVGKGGEVLN
jgi:hypothetical protein